MNGILPDEFRDDAARLADAIMHGHLADAVFQHECERRGISHVLADGDSPILVLVTAMARGTMQ